MASAAGWGVGGDKVTGGLRRTAWLVVVLLAALLLPDNAGSQGPDTLPYLASHQLGDGWETVRSYYPDEEERGEWFPWAEEIRFFWFSGPLGARVLLTMARPAAGTAAAVAAADYLERRIEDVDDGTDRPVGDYPRQPPPRGCDTAMRTEGVDRIDLYPVGATACVAGGGEVLVALVSGRITTRTAGDSDQVDGAQASDLVIAAALGGASVADIAGTPSPATPAG